MGAWVQIPSSALNGVKMKRTCPTNPQLKGLINELKVLARKENVNIWKRIAECLEKSTRKRRIVNLSKLARYTKENDNIIVPGKVLASGEINHKLTVGAYQFSKEAKSKLEKNSRCLTIEELMTQNPKGKNLRIIG